MCNIVVINKGEKEIETPRQFLEHFGFMPEKEFVHNTIEMDYCLCQCDIIVVENKSWVGYEIRLESYKTEWLRNHYNKDSVRLICPQWVMNLTIKNSLHAINLFSKYLRLV